MGPGHPHGIELAAMALDPTPQSLIHQINDLLAGNLHIR